MSVFYFAWKYNTSERLFSSRQNVFIFRDILWLLDDGTYIVCGCWGYCSNELSSCCPLWYEDDSHNNGGDGNHYTQIHANNISPIGVVVYIKLARKRDLKMRWENNNDSMKGNGPIDNSRGVWCKKTVEKVKKKERWKKDHSGFPSEF